MKIIKNRFIYLGISGTLFILSLFLIFIPKLNLGIDMTGGMQVEYNYTNTIDLESIKTELQKEKDSFTDNGKPIINNISVYTITGEKTVAVVVGFYNNDSDVKLENTKKEFKNKVFDVIKKQDNTAIESKYINVGKSFGDYIKKTAIITLTLAVIAIAIYVYFAFSGLISGISVASFAIITIITLLHDVIVASGAFIFTSMFLPEFQIDTFFITALLTILGYSINDTIVVFDRIRDNLVKYAGKTGKNGKNLEEIIDLSVNETFTRSIFTSMTLFFVLTTIFLFGPETISGFILVMIYGTVFGTYSSIFIASPLLYEVNKNKKLSEYKKIEIKPEDKIVV